MPESKIIKNPLEHDSAYLHVTGKAKYVADIQKTTDTLEIVFGLSEISYGTIKSIDLRDVESSNGVIKVLTHRDIPGVNDVSPIYGDDPLFVEREILYHGQVIFAVVADSIKNAHLAVKKAKIHYAQRPPIVTIDEAIKNNSFLENTDKIIKGTPKSSIANSTHKISDEIKIGGQEHLYLEGQAALAIPGENNDLNIFVSSQHPTEVQHKIAEVLNLPNHSINVEVRRMGGGFGGKESQSNILACACALAAHLLNRPVRLVYDRDDDMKITGKRHDFLIKYKVGFQDSGKIDGIIFEHFLRCGMSYDLSKAIAGRAMMHSDNAYQIDNIQINSNLCKTNTPSNTAFRGFGGPQGMIGIERVMDHIAFYLKKNPTEIRKINFYQDSNKNKFGTTPYNQKVKDCIIQDLSEKLLEDSNYFSRYQEIQKHNNNNPPIRKGIAFTPVKFGISFNKTFLNQAGALIHIYTDGSIHLNHGGTEMGQGLHTKVRQIVAHTFSISIEKVKITATNTGKVPNTSATAASSGTDLNGMAAFKAAERIKNRIKKFLAKEWQLKKEQVLFKDGFVFLNKEKITFKEAVERCWMGRVSLSSTGFYSTPKINWDDIKKEGNPFYYFAYGAAITEVAVDTFTGENRILRTDILHDAGQSINPAIDIGQIEGGYVQGAGWMTTEELIYDKIGQLKTHAPSTYKIPACSDRPIIFNASLYKGKNKSKTIFRSKAVGEPPLMLAISVIMALSNSLLGISKNQYPNLNIPATPENMLMTIKKLKSF